MVIENAQEIYRPPESDIQPRGVFLVPAINEATTENIPRTAALLAFYQKDDQTVAACRQTPLHVNNLLFAFLNADDNILQQSDVIAAIRSISRKDHPPTVSFFGDITQVESALSDVGQYRIIKAGHHGNVNYQLAFDPQISPQYTPGIIFRAKRLQAAEYTDGVGGFAWQGENGIHLSPQHFKLLQALIVSEANYITVDEIAEIIARQRRTPLQRDSVIKQMIALGHILDKIGFSLEQDTQLASENVTKPRIKGYTLKQQGPV